MFFRSFISKLRASAFARKPLLPLLTLSAATFYLSTHTTLHGIDIQMQSEGPEVPTLETNRANKPQLIQAMNSCSEETVILIYNRQSEEKLRERIVKIEGICESVGVKKLLLVDQTDVRHLGVIAKLIREDIEDPATDNDSYSEEPVDLQGSIKILYIHPSYNSMKPFTVGSEKQLPSKITQIRSILQINPSKQQLSQSLASFNKTSVVKNCYNETCVDEFKEKVRHLIESGLLEGKDENYGFFVSTNKGHMGKILPLLQPVSSDKQEIYVFYNDILGKGLRLNSKWHAVEGHAYDNLSQFMMLIRPRVHIIGQSSSTYTDLMWYMAVLRNKGRQGVCTFSINDCHGGNSLGDLELLKRINEKYEKEIQLMVVRSEGVAELLRHIARKDWRYVVFKLGREVPYPKLPIEMTPHQQHDDYDYETLFAKLDSFLKNPKRYGRTPLQLYHEKEKEINGQDLVQFLRNSPTSDGRWVFRVCRTAQCFNTTVYERYSKVIHDVPVYRIDARVSNIGIDEGDYIVENGIVKDLKEWRTIPKE